MKNRIVLFFPLCVAPLMVVLFAVPDVALAGLFDAETLGSFFTFPIRLIAYLINYIGGLFIMLGAFFVSFMIDLNGMVATSNKLVEVGWAIMRDIANLGFVIVIIVIAFGTMFRLQNYGVQKLLPKLIGAAILVNFSLTIGHVIINFSHVATNFFFEKISGESSASVGIKITHTITSAFGPQKFLLEDENPIPPDPSEEAGSLARFGGAFLTSLGSIILSIIFTYLMAFILFVFAMMFFVRYLYLSFLLLISPIIWLFWVIPAFQKYWNQWWDTFFQWTFFSPALAFFLYLALVAAETLGKTGFAKSVATGTMGTGNSFLGAAAQGAQMTVLAGLLVGGLIAARSFGIVGANAAVKAVPALIKGAAKSPFLVGGKAWQASGLGQKIGGTKLGKTITGGYKKLTTQFTQAAGTAPGKIVTAAAQQAFQPTTLLASSLGGVGQEMGLWSAPKEKRKEEDMTLDELRKQKTVIGKEIDSVEKGGGDASKQRLQRIKVEEQIEKKIRLDVKLNVDQELDRVVKDQKERKTDTRGELEQELEAAKAYHTRITTPLPQSKKEGGMETADEAKKRLADNVDHVKPLNALIRKLEDELGKVEKKENKEKTPLIVEGTEEAFKATKKAPPK